MGEDMIRKCKYCMEYFHTNEFIDFCSERCERDWLYSYEDDYDDYGADDGSNYGEY